MRVTVVQAGGIAGLVTTYTADTADLGAVDAHELRQLVVDTGLLASPGQGGPRSEPQPDRYDQEIVVDRDGEQARLRVSDQDAPRAVRDLVRFVRLVPGATQTIGPPVRRG